MDLSGRKYDIFIRSQHLPGLPGLPGGLQRLVLELTNLQGSILAAKRPLAFLDPLGGHLWLNRVEPPMISWFFPKQKGELSCTKLEKIWFWDDFSLRHLVKWSLNQIPSFNHLAYKKLPGGYIFLGGDAGMGWTYHPPNACGDQPLLRPWVWRREWHQWY